MAETRTARVQGWRRSFCMRSIHHRGSESAPGLVLALDAAQGLHCDGVTFRVRAGAEAETLALLRERELISSAYLETQVWADWSAGGGGCAALAYVIDRTHWQYCGALELEEQAQIIARAQGGRGTNRDYLWSTAAHLAELGLDDPELEWLSARVCQIVGRTA